MRIIAGKAGRIRLQVPKGVTRPTTDRVREAIFSILGGRVFGARVLDLFAGSGALGIEALSRGAREAVFVDRSEAACDVIRGNLDRTGLEGAVVIRADAEKVLRKAAEQEPYELIFADPPYRKEAGDRDRGHDLLDNRALRICLAAEGILVLEKMHEKAALQAGPEWEIVDSRTYGSTDVVFLRAMP